MTGRRQDCNGEHTILLVDDEPGIISVFKMMLEHVGYVVLPATTPEEAIRIAGVHRDGIGLLLTDVMMPEMNGVELAQHIRSLCPDLKVLFMTGHMDLELTIADGTPLLQKPLSMNTLCDVVAKLLGTTET